jgi:hypothetical protein
VRGFGPSSLASPPQRDAPIGSDDGVTRLRAPARLGSAAMGAAAAAAAAAPPPPPPAERGAALARSWHRVASTHSLASLLAADAPHPAGRGPRARVLALGAALLAAGGAAAAAAAFAFLVTPRLELPPTGGGRLIALARAVQADRYYRLLVPLTLPVTLAAVRRQDLSFCATGGAALSRVRALALSHSPAPSRRRSLSTGSR